MTAFDIINAAFEVAAGFFVLNHCRVLVKDRICRGVSIVSVVFFTVWGVWGLFYYEAIAQPWSAGAAVFVVLANALYLGLLLWYRKHEKPIVIRINFPPGLFHIVSSPGGEPENFDDLPPRGRGVLH